MARNYRKNYSNDPRVLVARFDSKCAETGKTIKKGDECVYYPSSKEVFHMDSKTAYDFRMWKMDIECFGANY